MQNRLPDRRSGPFAWGDPRISAADFSDSSFDGVVWRRSVAFVIDCIVLLAIFAGLLFVNVVTFFIASALVMFLWAAPLFVIYDTALIGGRGSATIGMRLMGLRTVTWQGGEPGHLQALVLSVLFYLSVTFTSGLVLLVPLFTDRGRCLHDILAGVFVINAAASESEAC